MSDEGIKPALTPEQWGHLRAGRWDRLEDSVWDDIARVHRGVQAGRCGSGTVRNRRSAPTGTR